MINLKDRDISNEVNLYMVNDALLFHFNLWCWTGPFLQVQNESTTALGTVTHLAVHMLQGKGPIACCLTQSKGQQFLSRTVTRSKGRDSTCLPWSQHPQVKTLWSLNMAFFIYIYIPSFNAMVTTNGIPSFICIPMDCTPSSLTTMYVSFH